MDNILYYATLIIVAIIEAFAAKDRKKSKEDRELSEQRAELRSKESILNLKMADASLQLSVVTSNALTNGHNNGNVERARKAAEEAQKEYEMFLDEIALKKLSK